MVGKLEQLSVLNQQRRNVIARKNCGILSTADTLCELQMISKKEKTVIRDIVAEKHVKNNGEPRNIAYDESKQLYYTLMPGKIRIYAKTEEMLYQRILEWYNIIPTASTFEKVFEAALADKQNEVISYKTFKKYKTNYKRFITDDLAKRNIKEITKADLKEYTATYLSAHKLKPKAFDEYRGIFYLVFNFAEDQDLIDKNPTDVLKDKKYLKKCEPRKKKNEADDIYSPEEILIIQNAIRDRMKRYPKRYPGGYDIHGYAILFSIETGMRVGELIALKWADIDFESGIISIHAQILDRDGADGKKEYYYEPYTKDEKGKVQGGREFPITDTLKGILSEIKAHQERLGIHPEFIFARSDGSDNNPDQYAKSLKRLIEKLGFKLTNNHTFRKSFNSNVLIPSGYSPEDRGKLLGHTAETNMRNYSYAKKDLVDRARRDLNQYNAEIAPKSHQNCD